MIKRKLAGIVTWFKNGLGKTRRVFSSKYNFFEFVYGHEFHIVAFLILSSNAMGLFLDGSKLPKFVAFPLAVGWALAMFHSLKRGAHRMAIPEKASAMVDGVFDLKVQPLTWRMVMPGSENLTSFVCSSITMGGARELENWLTQNFGEKPELRSDDEYWEMTTSVVKIDSCDFDQNSVVDEHSLIEEIKGRERTYSYLLATVRLTDGYATMFKLAHDVEG